MDNTNKRAERLQEFERKAMPDQYFQESRTKFKEFYGSNFSDLRSAEKAFRNIVTLLLRRQDFPEPRVTSRVKERDECISKFDEKYRESLEKNGVEYKIEDYITDLIGVRVVCLYETDIRKIASILLSELKELGITDKSGDLESYDNRFGYKGVHLDLELDRTRADLPEHQPFKGWRFEVQIRTIVQDAWSEIDHKLKYKRTIPDDLKRRINALAALFEIADHEFEGIRDKTFQLEQEARSKSVEGNNTELDVFSFRNIIDQSFPDQDPPSAVLEDLVGEIKECKSTATANEIGSLIVESLDDVREYRSYLSKLGHSMSALNMVRHSLCASNEVVYGPLLFDGHRRNFLRWLEHGTVHPGEIER